MMGTAHIIGAGVAGLAAAIRAVEAGYRVHVYEGARYAGGRCRAYFEPALGHTIDNGTHLVLGANPAVWWYTRTIGSIQGLHKVSEGSFPMVDGATGVPFTLGVRAALSTPMDSVRLALARSDTNVFDCLADSPWRARLWQPLTESILNTPLREASAAVLRRVLWQVISHGKAGIGAYVATPDLASVFVNPALKYLQNKGANIVFHKRLKAIHTNDNRLEQLVFTDGIMSIPKGDIVILALPLWQTVGFFPYLSDTIATAPIVNVHARVENQSIPTILGFVNSSVHWIFARPHGLSITVSAADTLALEAADTLAQRLWADVHRALPSLPVNLPAYKVIKEKNATFRATPAFEAQRRRLYKNLRERHDNLRLCGDWCAFGLPSTLEGSLQSGMNVFRDEARHIAA